MKFAYKVVNLQEYFLSNAYQHIEMIIYSVFCFFLPIALNHPQIVVGVAVNALLVLAALNLKGYKLLPVIITPSLGALCGAALFGSLTAYLVYLAPFIWIGNAILVYSFKFFRLGLGKNYWIVLLLGTLFKSGFLFLAAVVLYSLGLIPGIFLTAMGIMQFATAILGGSAAYAVQYAKARLAA